MMKNKIFGGKVSNYFHFYIIFSIFQNVLGFKKQQNNNPVDDLIHEEMGDKGG